MTELQMKTSADAIFFWEIGMLRFLFEKGIISDAEYIGIKTIAENRQEQERKKVCLE